MTAVPHESILSGPCLAELMTTIVEGGTVEIETAGNKTFRLTVSPCKDGHIPAEGLPVKIPNVSAARLYEDSNGIIILKWSMDLVALHEQRLQAEQVAKYRGKCVAKKAELRLLFEAFSEHPEHGK